MKTTKNLVLSALSAAALFSLTHSAKGHDEIAASPKLQQILSEQRMLPATESSHVVLVRTPAANRLAASPKLQQILARPGAADTGSYATSSMVRNSPVESRGIAASPRLRQMLNEQGMTFQIAPVK